MKNDALTQTISAGSDPRGLPEFSAIREEINKASHPSQPELNWQRVESLALAIFKTNGVDLHTATYYTLARTRLHGLKGFCEGVELLAAMICHEWDKFWPQGSTARTEMLDWLNTRTGNILRQQLSFVAADLPLLYRTERALQLICDKLQQVELPRHPRVENLLYFIQNTRKRLEPSVKQSGASTSSQAMVRTLVYAPECVTPGATDAMPSLPDLPEMTVQVRSVTDSGTRRVQRSTLKGFVAGVGCTALIAAALWWWQVYPMQRQLALVRDTAQGAAMIWLADPELGDYRQRLQPLSDASPLLPLETGLQMTHTAENRWPKSLQQQQVSTHWHDTLKNRAQNSPQLRGWQQTRQDLRAFAELLLEREQAKAGFTLSSVKTVIYQAERTLNQETPLESLVTQYQDAQARQENTYELEKQINARIDGLLSRWLLLKNSVRSDVGTSAGK